MITEKIQNKIKEVLNLLKDLNSQEADNILRQSRHNLLKASTVGNLDDLELEISGAK